MGRLKGRRLTASESQIQCAFIELVRRYEGRYYDLKFLRSFPNGGMRPGKINPKTGSRYSPVAQRMQREGVAPGPMDIILPTRRGAYTGLWFEFKVPGKKMTPEQLEYATYLTGQGWYCGTWFDAVEAWADVKRYLEQPDA